MILQMLSMTFLAALKWTLIYQKTNKKYTLNQASENHFSSELFKLSSQNTISNQNIQNSAPRHLATLDRPPPWARCRVRRRSRT